MRTSYSLIRRLLALGVFLPALSCTAPLVPKPATCVVSGGEPRGLMLSWQQDPTTTMTVDWHLNEGDKGHSRICYKEAGAAEWIGEIEGVENQFTASDRAIFRAEITGLEPGTLYDLQVGGYSRRFTFRTMPANTDERKVVFAIGGDTLSVPGLIEQTNKVAMRHDLDFVAWGGDLAYANGRDDAGGRLQWEWWFDANIKSLVTDDGRVVPIVVGIGNHEVQEGYYSNHANYEQTDAFRASIAPNFHRFFAFPGQPGYGVLDFGNYLSLVVLDTDHTNPIDGAQTDWLRGVLEARRKLGIPHVFPMYHVPAYPSHRSFDTSNSIRVRTHWVPLFEANGVKVAFENHDHTYKRTHPIRAGAVNPDGIVFVGDGAWGVPTRAGDNRDAWYIAQFASEQHAIIVTLQGKSRHIKAVSVNDTVLDEYGTLPSN